MNYVDDYLERLLRMESIMGSRLDQQKKEKKVVQNSKTIK